MNLQIALFAPHTGAVIEGNAAMNATVIKTQKRPSKPVGTPHSQIGVDVSLSLYILSSL